MKKLILTLSLASFITGCAPSKTSTPQIQSAPKTTTSETQTAKAQPSETLRPDTLKTAVFAGGCFWCVEADFEKLDGVYEAVSGYTGGQTKNPDYKTVTFRNTGHFEAVRVSYDPSIVNYSQLLDYFWRHIDPTDPNGQFCDQGASYRTAVFADESQIDIAEQSKNDIAVSKPFDGPVTTDILPLGTFYNAEDYHQDYYKKHPFQYTRYRVGCRRDARLEQLWGKPSLTPKASGSGK